MYHSVSDAEPRDNNASCLSLMGMVISKQRFEKQVELLAASYNVISLEELVSRLKTGQRVPANSIVVTLDDGLKDNFRVAFPILEKNRIKASFFVIGDSLVKGSVAWNHLLYKVIDLLASRDRLAEAGNRKPGTARKGEAGRKIALANEIKKKVERLLPEEKERFVKQYAEKNGIPASEISGDGYYMTAQEIEKLVAAGHTIGAHSMSHNMLSRLPMNLREREIYASRDIVREITKNRAVPFSYPFGTRDSFEAVDKELLGRSQLECGVSTIEGLNGPKTDIYELRRIEIGNVGRIAFVVRASGIIGDMKLLLKKMIKQ